MATVLHAGALAKTYGPIEGPPGVERSVQEPDAMAHTAPDGAGTAARKARRGGGRGGPRGTGGGRARPACSDGGARAVAWRQEAARVGACSGSQAALADARRTDRGHGAR